MNEYGSKRRATWLFGFAQLDFEVQLRNNCVKGSIYYVQLALNGPENVEGSGLRQAGATRHKSYLR